MISWCDERDMSGDYMLTGMSLAIFGREAMEEVTFKLGFYAHVRIVQKKEEHEERGFCL